MTDSESDYSVYIVAAAALPKDCPNIACQPIDNQEHKVTSELFVA